MKILGIIAEYNPFHSGHKYQIDKARQISGADYVIAVISGNYVQRGAPAVFDVRTRTQMALTSGADAVFEIPSFFAASSAADFASYGVSLLNILGADFISFGAESNDCVLLKAAAYLLNDGRLDILIKNKLKEGVSYAKARYCAMSQILKNDSAADILKYEEALSAPNNILAIEYLRNILSRGLDIKPVIIGRSGSGYHEGEINRHSFSSATAIRKRLLCLSGSEEDAEDYRQGGNELLRAVPNEIFDIYMTASPLSADDFTFAIQRNIMEKLYRGDELAMYCDVTAEMANTVKKHIFDISIGEFDSLIQLLKSKNYTYTRISRALFHIFLNHLKQDLAEYKTDENFCAYAKLLGFKKASSTLLSELKKRCRYPIISKASDAESLLDLGRLKLFKNNIYSDFLYNSVYFEKYGVSLDNPYRRNIVRV